MFPTFPRPRIAPRALASIAACGLAATALPAAAQDGDAAPAQPTTPSTAPAPEKSPFDPGGFTPEKMKAMVRYGLPLALRGAYATCAGHLPADSFMIANRDSLIARYSAGAERYWPQARNVLATIIASESGDASLGKLAAMPDEALRPFVDAMLTEVVASKVKPDTCSTLNQVVEQIAPLPPENLANLIGIVAGLTHGGPNRAEDADAPAE